MSDLTEWLIDHAGHMDDCGDHDAYNNADVHTCGCGLDSVIEQVRLLAVEEQGDG